MGFERSAALMALRSTNYESEELAINFLIEKDPVTQRYQHPFVQMANS